ncbi:LysR family transcriptional regulator [Geomonas silvestris]|uniref:LysR family transcriptional regulator n=1 Tax=Geomonas silvestris TaxID=2740184 RepID=A0A6V8MIX8_9BACT|nr:selenium metabolism-associated LysR family transcriptional regulator [Geomonas silvestris]GFO59907.1 LysR family transcriptional regulator [Geomonas silvestris]
MNLKQLEVFINVAESGSFSKGAEATFITQSTVSQHISALESEFGLKLLDRTGKGALLTEGGKLLLERARRLVEYAREITVAVDRFKGVEEAVLRIAGSSIPGEYIIPAALPLLLGKFPGLTLIQAQGDSQDVLDKLKAEQVEFGVVGAALEDDAIEYTPFAKDHLVLIAPAGHRWAGSGPVALQELVNEPFVLREPGSGTGRAYLNALWQAGIKPANLKVAAQLGSNEAIKRAVMAGVGVSFVSEISVQREVTQGALVQVPVAGIDIKREFFLARRKGRELSPAALAFARVLQELYAGGNA